jgi:hypothetical protein
MEYILDDLKLPYTLYNTSFVIEDYNELSKYDILLINCGAEENLNPDTIRNLQNWVMAGNSFMVSDYAYDYVERAFPNAIDFYGDDNTQDSAQSGGSNRPGGCTAPLTCDIVDQNLVAVMGVTQVGIASICWATMDSAASDTVVHIEGDIYGKNAKNPVIASYKPTQNSGRVTFASFHLKDQNAANMKKIFFYLIFQM